MQWLKKVFNVIKDTVLEFLDDNCPVIAGAVAYSALQGIISLILGFIALGSLILQDKSSRDSFVRGVSAVIPQELNNSGILDLNGVVEGFTKNVGTVSFISIVALLWTGSGIFGQLKFAINTAFDVSKDQRNIFFQFGLQIVMVAILGGLLLLAFGISIVSTLIFNVKVSLLGISPYNFSFLLPVITFSLPPLLETIIFALLFRYSPARKGIRWKPILLAAAITAVLFELLKVLFSLYLSIFGVANSTARTFGAIGGIFIFLFYLYLNAIVILIGAELASVLHNFKSGLASSQVKGAVVETKGEEIKGELVPEKAAKALKETEAHESDLAEREKQVQQGTTPSAGTSNGTRSTPIATAASRDLIKTIVAGIVLVVASLLQFLVRRNSRSNIGKSKRFSARNRGK